MPRWTEDDLKAYEARQKGNFALDGGAVVTGAKRRPQQHEMGHQRALVRWVSMQWFAPYFAHWPNERPQRIEALQMTGLGVRKGLPDNWLFLPRHGHCMAVSELKAKETDARPTPEQRGWLVVLEQLGALATWHDDWEQCAAWLSWYAGSPLPGDPEPPTDTWGCRRLGVPEIDRRWIRGERPPPPDDRASGPPEGTHLSRPPSHEEPS